MKIKEKYKLRKSSGSCINHVDKENIDVFGISFGGAITLNLTHASDL
jgi:cephalosporin-C deacetylase-like acetyl esterase